MCYLLCRYYFIRVPVKNDIFKVPTTALYPNTLIITPKNTTPFIPKKVNVGIVGTYKINIEFFLNRSFKYNCINISIFKIIKLCLQIITYPIPYHILIEKIHVFLF